MKLQILLWNVSIKYEMSSSKVKVPQICVLFLFLTNCTRLLFVGTIWLCLQYFIWPHKPRTGLDVITASFYLFISFVLNGASLFEIVLRISQLASFQCLSDSLFCVSNPSVGQAASLVIIFNKSCLSHRLDETHWHY